MPVRKTEKQSVTWSCTKIWYWIVSSSSPTIIFLWGDFWFLITLIRRLDLVWPCLDCLFRGLNWNSLEGDQDKKSKSLSNLSNKVITNHKFPLYIYYLSLLKEISCEMWGMGEQIWLHRVFLEVFFFKIWKKIGKFCLWLFSLKIFLFVMQN